MRCWLPTGLTVHLSNGISRFWSPIVFFSRYFLWRSLATGTIRVPSCVK